ncbi:sulfite exporter TauE/SafE family protein [Granulicella sp. dw_53]|uniref:sulfite exporter TauE/SafE family protein n=1 Tax=Granulicella sp. dw_53 TaxID=2719792 RepID=UPI001BD64F15|nr:sulfite exporter TauE/SafE family protein [Granulicella sp. dw_53]
MEFLIGFVVAIVIALTGVGASVVTAPLLILFLKVPVDIAVSTTLAYSAIVKLIVVPFQVVRRQINYRILGIMLLGGVPGVISGSVFFKHVAAHGPKTALTLALGLIIFFTAAWHLYRHFRPANIVRAGAERSKWLAAITFPIGAEIGFSSAGAGALGTVALLGLTSLTATQVVGTDLAFGLVIAVVGTGVHLIGGHYDAILLAKLAAGGVVGGLIGSGAAPKIPNRNLRFALSLWLLFIGLQFCYQAATK